MGGGPLWSHNTHQRKKSPLSSVGASGVRRGWVGLYGRPRGGEGNTLIQPGADLLECGKNGEALMCYPERPFVILSVSEGSHCPSREILHFRYFSRNGVARPFRGAKTPLPFKSR